MDGESFAGLLRNGSFERKQGIGIKFRNYYGSIDRTGQYKWGAHQKHSNIETLIDLWADPGETNDISHLKPTLLGEIKAEYAAWEDTFDNDASVVFSAIGGNDVWWWPDALGNSPERAFGWIFLVVGVLCLAAFAVYRQKDHGIRVDMDWSEWDVGDIWPEGTLPIDTYSDV